MQFWPVYSSHGYGRKTHLANSHGGETLCRAESRYPWLLLTFGTCEDEGIKNIRAIPNPDGILCAICKRIADKIHN